MNGLDLYDFSARQQDPVLGRFTTMDPLCEKYYSVSPYAYYANNPIKYTDPSGMSLSTDVTKNSDGTYSVSGGKADGDLNIYVSENGQRTGEILGQSLTEYSFLNDDGSAVIGAIINPSDFSGAKFISKEIMGDNPSILKYMPNATGGEDYDFKRRGMGEGLDKEERNQYCYRGMPFAGSYASARDIGNYGAGYMAGKSGLTWGLARLGFDALESWDKAGLHTEGMPTQLAERKGFDVGQKVLISNFFKMVTLFKFPQ